MQSTLLPRSVAVLAVGACLSASIGADAQDAAAPVPPSPASPAIVVQVTGARNDRGLLRCAIFNSAQGYPVDPRRAVHLTSSLLHGGVGTCRFDGLPPATYAIAAFHDENNNNAFDRNFIGIPTEGSAASNGARGHMGPPHYDDARFVYAGGVLPLHLALGY